jgi:hypothetical protein
MEESIELDFDSDDLNNDWVDKVYYENGVKVTRYKPSWYKEPEQIKYIKSHTRKPTFGPKDP